MASVALDLLSAHEEMPLSLDRGADFRVGLDAHS